MSNEIVLETNSRISVQEIKEQVHHIQELLRSVMVKDEHYGVIPGCGNKPTLLKAGAEKLALTFRLDLETDIEVFPLPSGHREYRAKTTVYSLASGKRMGNGSGSATTLETKWRYRAESTGQKVPKEYWETRNSDLIGGSQFSTRKIDGVWYITHKVEHDNPADYYNTCMKMSEKRAKVNAILSVTCASDIFTQDIEDMPLVSDNNSNCTGTKPVQQPKSKVQTPKKEDELPEPIKEEKFITSVHKITKRGLDFRILGDGDIIYTTRQETYATVAKSAKDAGLQISGTHREFIIINIDIVEPRKETQQEFLDGLEKDAVDEGFKDELPY